jgi:deazaflavin-dependent oxidoreductase (nitroreductase family)
VNPEVERALASDLVIDLTTTGRKSGEPRTVEMWFHRVDGRYYITGWPGSRGWYANILADPSLVIRFKDAGTPDLAAVAHPITEPALRRRVLDQVYEVEGGEAGGDFDSWLARSPIIEFTPA